MTVYATHFIFPFWTEKKSVGFFHYILSTLLFVVVFKGLMTLFFTVKYQSHVRAVQTCSCSPQLPIPHSFLNICLKIQNHCQHLRLSDQNVCKNWLFFLSWILKRAKITSYARLLCQQKFLSMFIFTPIHLYVFKKSHNNWK